MVARGRPTRLGLVIGGFLVALMGAVWALQGAYLLEATFMRGPEWIAIGSAVCLLGVLMVWRGLHKKEGVSNPDAGSQPGELRQP